MPDLRVMSISHLILTIRLEDAIIPSFTEAESWIKKFAQGYPAICLPLGSMILWLGIYISLGMKFQTQTQV